MWCLLSAGCGLLTMFAFVVLYLLCFCLVSCGLVVDFGGWCVGMALYLVFGLPVVVVVVFVLLVVGFYVMGWLIVLL